MRVGPEFSSTAVPLRPISERMSVSSLLIQSRRRTLFVALLALAPMFAACERVDQISGIEMTDVTATARRTKTAQVVTADVTASGIAIGSASYNKGVTLSIGQYRLVVPKRAVPRKTVFVMTVTPGNAVAVSLKAYRDGAAVTTFDKELFLTLPYSEVVDPAVMGEDEETKLVVANISEDGSHSVLEIVNTGIDDEAKTVTGKITHFSIWAIAKEIIVGID